MIYDHNSQYYNRYLRVSTQRMKVQSGNTNAVIGKQEKNCDDGRSG